MSYFMKKGVELQEDSKTAKEACGHMTTSCNKCFKAAYCDETKCPIMMAHKARMLYFEAMESAKHSKIRLNEYLENQEKQKKAKEEERNRPKRKYTKMSLATKLRKELRKFLDMQYIPGMDRQIELIIDEASVANEQYQFKEAYNILYKNRLYIIAYHYYKIYSQIKENKEEK